MNAYRTLFRYAAPFAVAVAMGVPAFAAPPAATATLSRVHIDNFGQVDANYYRGAQPDGRDYDDLAALGVKTVIDLTQGGRRDEQGLVERAGMSFYRIPLTTTERPSEPALRQFLAIVNDPARQPVYVHCQGGQHRTGVMTAVYRMTKYGWTEEKAYDEMKQYKFETFIGHPELRHFVHDYSSRLTPIVNAVVSNAAPPAVDTRNSVVRD